MLHLGSERAEYIMKALKRSGQFATLILTRCRLSAVWEAEIIPFLPPGFREEQLWGWEGRSRDVQTPMDTAAVAGAAGTAANIKQKQIGNQASIFVILEFEQCCRPGREEPKAICSPEECVMQEWR